jgi:hypothetical protein
MVCVTQFGIHFSPCVACGCRCASFRGIARFGGFDGPLLRYFLQQFIRGGAMNIRPVAHDGIIFNSALDLAAAFG